MICPVMGQQRDGGGRGRNWPLWDNKNKKIEFNWEFKIPAAHKPLKEPPFIYSIYKTKTPPPPFHRVANWLFLSVSLTLQIRLGTHHRRCWCHQAVSPCLDRSVKQQIHIFDEEAERVGWMSPDDYSLAAVLMEEDKNGKNDNRTARFSQ